MKNEKCAIVEENLNNCEVCSEVYRKKQEDIRIVPALKKPDRKTLWYLNGARVWYLLCPLLAFIFTFYVRPLFWGIPALLVIIVAQLPRIVEYIMG